VIGEYNWEYGRKGRGKEKAERGKGRKKEGERGMGVVKELLLRIGPVHGSEPG